MSDGLEAARGGKGEPNALSWPSVMVGVREKQSSVVVCHHNKLPQAG